MFRKILTIVIFSVFVLCSLPFFLGLAISHTFFSRSFYTGTFLNTAYAPTINMASKSIADIDPAFQKHFSQDEISQLLQTHFTKDLLRNTVDKTSSAFSQDIAAVSPDSSKNDKLTFTIDFTPYQEPLMLFISDMVQQTLDRLPPCAAGAKPEVVGVFPSCSLASWQTDDFKKKFSDEFKKDYQQKIFANPVGPGETAFVRNLVLDVPRSDVAFALHQFEMMNVYTVLFVLAFISLMLLLWIRNFYTGLTLSSLMLVTASVLGLLLALILSRVVSLFPPEAITNPTVSQATFDLARDLLSVILMSFAKVYAVILGIGMLCSGAMYYYANRYLKKS